MADAPFSFLPLGAIIQTFQVNGRNIVLNFDTQEQYVKHNAPYFGETIGRIANRVQGAKINSLNGDKVYPLAANDGTNSLHGGDQGWGKKIWAGPKPVGIREIPGVEGLKGGESVEFTMVSEDGDEGYPGTLEVKVTYVTGTEEVFGKEVTVLGIEYEATLVGGAEETAVNMTNHSYFNLTGDETHAETIVTLGSTQRLPNDKTSIPTGGPVPFEDGDLTKPFILGPREPFIDGCFTTTADPSSVPIDTRQQPLLCNMEASHPKTGIHLQVLSTEPSFQFYTGYFNNVPAVDGLPARGMNSGFCCEPGRWVNAINVPEWRSQVVLKKGQTYGSRIVYKAWAE